MMTIVSFILALNTTAPAEPVCKVISKTISVDAEGRTVIVVKKVCEQ